MSDSAACACGTCATCYAPLDDAPVADPQRFSRAAIKRRMLSRIAAAEVEGTRPLARLGTREDSDPAIALLDAFAAAMHVLTWNAGRLSDDGALTRSQDRDALLDLGGLLGYQPRPALAATTTLALELDDFPGLPKVARIPLGTKVASVPGQDEKPQTFETNAELVARPEWNGLSPVVKKSQPVVTLATTEVVIEGVSTTARVGDLVLVYLRPENDENPWLCARVDGVVRAANPKGQPPHTTLRLTSQQELKTVSTLRGASFHNCVIVLGQRAAAFGATAPDLALMSDEIQEAQEDPEVLGEWRNLKMTPGGNEAGKGAVDLDAIYPDAVKGRAVLFRSGEKQALARVVDVSEHSRKGFGLAAKVTSIGVHGVELRPEEPTGFYDDVRGTIIYLETARETVLQLDQDERVPATTTPDRVTVLGRVDLPAGRRVVIFGELFDQPLGVNAAVGEVALIRESSTNGTESTLVFESSLSSGYHSTAVKVLANCVGAWQAEMPVQGAELLGSSNAAIETPSYALRAAPLAYVPAVNARGYAPALEVRVGDRLYDEVATLYGRTSSDPVYTVKTRRDGRSVIQFAGRLPSGTLNVSALYRVGGGAAGNLPAGRITTVMTPIVGVRKVFNPVPADGGSDAEARDDVRSAAPESIRTLDRVVSQADFEAFSRQFAGVGKALATELYVGMRSMVQLTIATTTMAAPAPGSELVSKLREALAKVAVPGRSIRIDGFTSRLVEVTLALASDPAFRRRDVEAAVRARLAETFSVKRRNFGEALHRSAVVAEAQRVPGVVAVTLPVFALDGVPADADGRLPCAGPRYDGSFHEAELLAIEASSVQFEELAP